LSRAPPDADVHAVLRADHRLHDVVKLVVCRDVPVCTNVGVEVGVGVETAGELVGIPFLDKTPAIEGVIPRGGLVVVERIAAHDTDEGRV
jgi:hypothetical protein